MSSGRSRHRRNRHGSGRHGDGERRPEPAESADVADSPVLAMFRGFAAQLDNKHDTYERLVKKSRDVTIESKRIIFMLHRVTRWDLSPLLGARQMPSLEVSDIVSISAPVLSVIVCPCYPTVSSRTGRCWKRLPSVSVSWRQARCDRLLRSWSARTRTSTSGPSVQVGAHCRVSCSESFVDAEGGRAESFVALLPVGTRHSLFYC